MVDGVDDPYPSLSDFHDYEPNLEFDDSDLLNTQHPEVEGKSSAIIDIDKSCPVITVVLLNIKTIFILLAEIFEEEPSADILESPMADGTIEEDFEAALNKGRVGSGNGTGGSFTGAIGNGPSIMQEAIEAPDYSGTLLNINFYDDSYKE